MKRKDAPYKEINPTQRFQWSGNLEDRITESTQDSGAKKMNTPGKQIASAVNGKCRKSVTSLMISLDKVMKLIFSEESALRTGQARWFTESCCFITITMFPLLLGWFPPWIGFSCLLFLVSVNSLRYKVVRLSNAKGQRPVSAPADTGPSAPVCSLWACHPAHGNSSPLPSKELGY